MGRLYKDNTGALCKQTSYSYNPSSQNTWFSDETTAPSCGVGNYYSYGVTRAFNGNGYNSYYTFKSPNVTLS